MAGTRSHLDRAHETARLRRRGYANPERQVERLWQLVEELMARVDTRCLRALHEDWPLNHLEVDMPRTRRA